MAERRDLVDEGDLIRRSLEDLHREHAAGDIEDADYEQLHAQYSARALAVSQSLQQADDADHAASPTRANGQQPDPAGFGAGGSGAGSTSPSTARLSARARLGPHRRKLAVAAGACFVVAALFPSLALAGVAPFASAPSTLTVADRIRIELGEAGVLAANNHVARAISVYDQVLQLDPQQPEALADGGWLVRLAGLSARKASIIRSGDVEIALAVQFAPGYALARAYAGVVRLEDDHDPSGAVAEFRAMLADHPSSTLLRSARGYAMKAFLAAHQPVPPAIAHPPAAKAS
jgi:hypothetical protein